MLQVALLGEQRLTLNGESLNGVLPRRLVEIVTNLALRPGQPQPRSQLAVMLWPDSTDSQAMTNLRRELHNLRAVLGADETSVVADSRTVCWQPRPTNECDVADFVTAATAARQADKDGDQKQFIAQAVDAVSCYGGMLLPASTEEWVLTERDRLHRQCVQLLDRLVALEESNALSEALEHAERRLALEPMEERSYQVLMRLQSAAGDRAASIHTYHRCVSILDKELGVAPDAATIALYGRLVASDRRTNSDPARARPTIERRAPGEPELVGRERELAALYVWQHGIASGAAPLHLLRGEAGMGKSRLIREVAARATASGHSVVVARCYAGPGRIALSPVAEWLGCEPMRAHRPQVDAEWRAEVDRLLPTDASERGSSRPSPMVDAWQRHHFFEGLARALLQPARPTLLVLDDLQWCDAETLAWLPMFLGLADGYPIQLLAGVRDEQVAGNRALADTLRDLRASGRSVETELTALSAAATAALAGSVLGSELSEQDAVRWREATGGVPLFVIETARSKLAQDPRASDVGHLPRVQAVLMSRLQEVSEPAQQVAGLAAAFGRAFSLGLLTEAGDHSEDVIVDAVDELWRRRIIRGHDGATYDFTHDLLREAAYELTSPPLRPLLHRRIAQAIELRAGGDRRAVAAALAEQYDRAQAPKRAIGNYAIAAEDATEVFAFDDAVRRYRRAVELLPELAAGRQRDQLELELLHAMSAPLNAIEGYASSNLRESLERSAVLAERLGERRLHVLTLVALFAVRFVQGDVLESYRIGERALALSSGGPDEGQAHFALGGAAAELGRHTLAVDHFDKAHQLAIDQPPSLVGTRPEVHARAWCAHPLWVLGRVDEATSWADWAIARAEEVEQPYSLAVALAYASITHQLMRDVEATAHFAERTMELCTRYDFAYYQEWGALLSGWCLGGDAGATHIREALRALQAQGAHARRPYYMSLLAETLLDSGETDRARAVLDDALGAATERDDLWWTPELLRLKARAAEPGQRADLLKQARSTASWHGSVTLLERIDSDLADL